MHVVTILRYYLGITQAELAEKSGVPFADVNEIENKPNNGLIDKYARLAAYLHVPVHTVVMNDILGVPEPFFAQERKIKYTNPQKSKNGHLGRLGEEDAFRQEQERLNQINPTLAKLVVPKYKIRGSRGYDIISFKEDGTPFFIEVKTFAADNNSPQLTKCEYDTAKKLTKKGYEYWIYSYSAWGTENQHIEKTCFLDLMNDDRITPVRYVCDIRPRKKTENGILHFRKKVGLSQIEAASMMEIPASCLCKYEIGENQCPVTAYQKIAKLYQATIDELLSEYPVNSVDDPILLSPSE